MVYANLSGAMKEQAECILDAAVDYQLTQKGQPFKGHDVSLNSLSELIVNLALTPGMESRHCLGVSGCPGSGQAPVTRLHSACLASSLAASTKRRSAGERCARLGK